MRTKKRLFGILLTLAFVLGLIPGMATTAHAATSPYTPFLVTTDANKNKTGDDLAALQVTFNGVKWYIVEDNSDNTAMLPYVVLLAADETFGKTQFYYTTGATYAKSDLKAYLDGLTATGGFLCGCGPRNQVQLPYGGAHQRRAVLSAEQ